MNLLQRLWALHGAQRPLEDFFTEVVAHLFATSPAMLRAWLAQAQVLDPQPYRSLQVSTQVWQRPLPHHPFPSRFDMLVELWDGTLWSWLVLESKIGASEGPDQLRRYAELLAAQPALRERVLLYVTRGVDRKEAEPLVHDLPGGPVRFVQLRWNHLYHFLQQQPTTMLIREIQAFMEEHGMAQPTRWTPQDVLTLTNLRDVVQLMNACLDNDIRSKFQEVLRVAPRVTGTVQLANGRYFLWGGPGPEWWVGVGFCMPVMDGTEYPTVRFQVELASPTGTPTRDTLLMALREISGRPHWRGYQLDSTRGTFGVYQEQSLAQFLIEDDQVSAIKSYLLSVLDEVGVLTPMYGALPWATLPPMESETNREPS